MRDLRFTLVSSWHHDLRLEAIVKDPKGKIPMTREISGGDVLIEEHTLHNIQPGTHFKKNYSILRILSS